MVESNLLEFNSDISSSAKAVASTTAIEFEYLMTVCDSVEIVLNIPSDESIVVDIICIDGIDSYEVEFDYIRHKHNRIIVPRSSDINLSINQIEELFLIGFPPFVFKEYKKFLYQ